MLLRQAVAQATRLLYNATEWSKRASARKEETGIELQEAHVSLQEAEEEVARMDKQQFSEEQARAHNDKAQAGREVEAARVSDEHATNALEQSNTAVSECLSLLDSIHRIQGKQPRVSLEALVKEASTIFTQLAVRLPEEYQDDDPVDGEGDGDDSYAYYEDDLAPPTPPPALLIVQHQSASPPPPPSPAAPVDTLKELQGMAEEQVEALELQIIKHPVFALGVALAGLLLLCIFVRCCCRRRTVPIVEVASECDPQFDDGFEDDDGFDEEFEEIEMEGRGRGRAARSQERETLNLGPSSTGEQRNGARRGGGRAPRC